MTRICIFGAGAIGGLIGARLAIKGDAEVSLVARGAHLAAIRERGLTLKQAGTATTVRPRATANSAELGHQDFVILALKAHAVQGAIDALLPLLGPETAILFAQNGLPWWYFHGIGGPYEGLRLESVDPGGVIWDRIGPGRALGTVVWQSAEIEAPGIVAHHYGDRMPVAEPAGVKSERVQRIGALLTAAGIRSPVRANLRDEIWLKLWGNLSFNPLSILTEGTLEALAADPGTRRVVRLMMDEARHVAECFGVEFAVDAEERIGMAAKVGAHRTSMLQDVEAGRRTELDALLGVVIELGEIAGVATPCLNLVYDLAKFRGQGAERRGHNMGG